MYRMMNFPNKIKKKAIIRQNGKCAFCGIPLLTPWTKGQYKSCAHHLRPIKHGGNNKVSNCVYLCWGHHLF